MFSPKTAALLVALTLCGGCVFDGSGLPLGDGWNISDCETGSCRSDAQPDSSVIDTQADGQQPDQQNPDTKTDIVPPDTLPDIQSDTNPSDTQLPCTGAGSASSIQLDCQTTGKSCKQGSTTTGTITYTKAVSFVSSFKWDSGQPVGFGVLTPGSGALPCDGTLNFSWQLPGGDLTTLTLTLTFTGGNGKTFQKSVQVTTTP